MSTALDPVPFPASDRGAMRPAMRESDERTRRHSGEVRKLTSLLDISRALSSPVIEVGVAIISEILERYHGTGRNATLPREDGRRPHLHVSTASARRMATPRLAGRSRCVGGCPIVILVQPRAGARRVVGAETMRPIAPAPRGADTTAWHLRAGSSRRCRDRGLAFGPIAITTAR